MQCDAPGDSAADSTYAAAEELNLPADAAVPHARLGSSLALSISSLFTEPRSCTEQGVQVGLPCIDSATQTDVIENSGPPMSKSRLLRALDGRRQYVPEIECSHSSSQTHQ